MAEQAKQEFKPSLAFCFCGKVHETPVELTESLPVDKAEWWETVD